MAAEGRGTEEGLEHVDRLSPERVHGEAEPKCRLQAAWAPETAGWPWRWGHLVTGLSSSHRGGGAGGARGPWLPLGIV